MEKKRMYPAVNGFKLLAALFVIMIHTSPLTSVSPEADFVLTRIIARVAVPFFFLVTGFFVLPGCLLDTAKGFRYLRRIGLIYLASVLLYLPVGFYAGHFQGAGPGDILRMLLVDGTFYHLWYLPALLLGFALMWVALRTLPLQAVCAVSLFLYGIGLFGDSYYGFLREGSLLYAVYQGIFHVSSYTRNGLFYAPAFLLLGYLISLQKPYRPKDSAPRFSLRPSFGTLLLGFSLSSALLFAEGITLRLLDVQRHDSMYLALLPLMYFLFCLLLDEKGGGRTARFFSGFPKDLPLLVYLLHPLFLILVRGFSKLPHLSPLSENSVLHFLAVAAASFAGSWVLFLIWQAVKTRFFMADTSKRPASDCYHFSLKEGGESIDHEN